MPAGVKFPPVEDYRDDSDPEDYCLGLLTEEAGEISQMVGKAFRFGLYTPGQKDEDGNVDMSITPYTELSKECGDMLAAIDFALAHGIIDRDIVNNQHSRKYDKLTDPDAKDNLGRLLAPQP